tara:strand:+ start:1039 stop:1392 length:354 start_codon:yes stop_codon:yes gene_type:complete
MVHSVLEIKPWGITNMVQQRSRQESLADEEKREKNTLLKKFQDSIKNIGSMPSFDKMPEYKLLDRETRKRIKEILKRRREKIKKRKKNEGKQEPIEVAKGGTIKVYAKGGGVRKVNY